MNNMRISVIVLAVAIAIVALPVAWFGIGARAESLSESHPPPEGYINVTYRTVENAQPMVDFPIRTLVTQPVGFQLASVSVHSRPVLELERNVTMVHVLYQNADGRMLNLIQRDADVNHTLSSGSTVSIAGKPIHVATETNIDGNAVGIVTWESDGLTLMLVGSEMEGSELTHLVNSVR